MIIVGALHLTLVGHDKLGNRAERHHGHEGLVGWSIIALRVVLCIWFLLRIRLLQQRGSSLKLHCFLQRFRAAGALYLLSYPALVLTVQLFAPYWRHPVMEIGLVVVQLVSAFWLSDLFLSRGDYYEISALSSSPLPSAGAASFKLD